MKNRYLIKKLYLTFNNTMLKDLTSSKEYKTCTNNLSDNYNVLKEKLDKDLLLIVDNIINLQDKLLALETEEAFINGYILARKL